MKKTIFIYGIGTIFSKILVFFMVPIYTRFLSSADYGYYDVMISDMQMLVSIGFFEIWSGVMRYLFSDEKKEKVVKAYLSVFPFMCVLYMMLIGVLSLFVEIKYPAIMVLYGISYFLYTMSTNLCRGYEKNKGYVIAGLLYTAVSCALCILFVVFIKTGIEYLFIAQIVGYIIASIYVEAITSAYRNSIKVRIKKNVVNLLLKYSFPLMLNSVSFMFLDTFNKNVIITYLGEYSSGQYAFVCKFTAILSTLISIFSLAWQEEAFKTIDNIEKDKIYSYHINQFIRIVGVGTSCYIFFVYLVMPYIGGVQYTTSNTYILYAVLSCFISQLSGVFSVIIAVGEKTFQTLISTVVSAVVNILIVGTFTNKYGINGASISLCIAFCVSTILRYIFSRRIVEIRIDVKAIAIICVQYIILQWGIENGNKNGYLYFVGGMCLIAWILMNYRFVKNETMTLLERKKQ